jgi:serine/threonine protein kinase
MKLTFLDLLRNSVSTVYQAVDSSAGIRVVIKSYHLEKMQPKHHHKLAREISAMKALNGSFVTELYSTFSDEKNIYIGEQQGHGGAAVTAIPDAV